MLDGWIAAAPEGAPLGVALGAIRQHLGMEVAYISEFRGDQSVFREVDAPGLEALIKPGDSHALDDVYCRHILAGRLPELMADTAEHPLAAAMPITAAVPIGAHMSVPIRGSDGAPMGMFCCLSPTPNAGLNARDLQVMRVFADMAGAQIGRRMEADAARRDSLGRIEAMIAARDFSFVFQPIHEFRSDRPVGFEALCRFGGSPRRTPGIWFNEAFAVGQGVALELAALEMALEALRAFPGDCFLSLNAAPETIMSGALAPLLRQHPLRRIVLEVTEHAPVTDYDALAAALAGLRAHGMRLAIDDAGAGFASLQHIIRLRPDIIKLDISLTRAVDVDPARRALAAALIFFGQETNSIIVAEGIETGEELSTLRRLGVPRGQGYFLGRPCELPQALTLVGDRRARPVTA